MTSEGSWEMIPVALLLLVRVTPRRALRCDPSNPLWILPPYVRAIVYARPLPPVAGVHSDNTDAPAGYDEHYRVNPQRFASQPLVDHLRHDRYSNLDASIYVDIRVEVEVARTVQRPP
jgi:hypothetical protein